jgi:CRISPR-associated protein Cas1
MQVYVHEQGAVVRKKGGLLQIMKGKDTLKELPLMKIEQLVLVGNVQVTTQAGKYMVGQGIDVVFLTTTGTFNYRYDKSETKFANLRRQQINLCNNPQRSMEIARQIVVGKINNQRVVLQRRTEEDARAATALKGMLDMLKRVEQSRDLDQLRGFEGKAAAYYFDGIRTFFPSQWRFQKREYYPPPDPANSLLSYAYTLMLKDVKTRLQLVGLDPSFGFFHALEDNRPSLALDVMEEFRPSICDIVVLTLVLQGQITLADFEETNEAGMPVYLSKEGREVLIAAYEQRLSEKIFHPMAQGETAYRNVIENQARQMRWVIEGRAMTYETVQLR